MIPLSVQLYLHNNQTIDLKNQDKSAVGICVAWTVILHVMASAVRQALACIGFLRQRQDRTTYKRVLKIFINILSLYHCVLSQDAVSIDFAVPVHLERYYHVKYCNLVLNWNGYDNFTFLIEKLLIKFIYLDQFYKV